LIFNAVSTRLFIEQINPLLIIQIYRSVNH